MKPLTIIYWTRLLLGIVAGLISTIVTIIIMDPSLFNGVTIALLIYIITYYVYKPLFLTKVEKPQKIFTTGVFAYFLAWIIAFTIFSTLMTPTMTITSPTPNEVFSTGETITIVAKITNQFGTAFLGANVTANIPPETLLQLNPDPTAPGTYQAKYNIASSDPTGAWNIKVAASINGRYREASITVSIQA